MALPQPDSSSAGRHAVVEVKANAVYREVFTLQMLTRLAAALTISVFRK